MPFISYATPNLNNGTCFKVAGYRKGDRVFILSPYHYDVNRGWERLYGTVERDCLWRWDNAVVRFDNGTVCPILAFNLRKTRNRKIGSDHEHSEAQNTDIAG